MGKSRFRFLLLAAICVAAPFWRAQSLAAQAAVAPGTGQGDDAKWPLRLHILAIDDTHRTVRMQPNWGSGSLPDVSGGEISGPSGSGSATLGGGDSDFSGAGRADLVTPPDGTAGLNFTYEGCNRLRVAPGFTGLAARWIKPGSKLEVEIPAGTAKDASPHVKRCTLKLATQAFVYLRLPNGRIVRVTQDAYAKKPSLRMFLSGGPEGLQRRPGILPRPTPPASEVPDR